MGTAHILGTDIFFSDTGGSGEPVVFLHGFLFDGRQFEAQVAALQNHYRCITMDWPGQGRSGRPKGGYTTDRLTTYAEAFIEQLNCGPVHLAGLSMGGFAAMRVAARRPDLLRSLILLNSSARPHARAKFPKQLALAGVARVAGIQLSPIVSGVEGEMYGDAFRADPAREDVRRKWRRRWAEADRHAMVQTLLGFMGRPDFRAQLAAVTVPALVIAGEDDHSLPVPQSLEIHEGIRGSRLEIVPRAGHSSPIEAPEAVSELLVDFLASAPAPSSS